MAILKSITCKGSFGIHYGMGIEEVSVDFDNITGLVALIGGNGMAKTTFMEMLSPFPIFPSRKLKNPSGYNLKKQFMLRDSFKEVRYSYDGHDYTFRLEIPAGTTMSPEGYITCDGEPIVNGKISQYKKKVVELFGSEALFYSSYFSCQGGEKLTDKTTGEFKQLLIELLGLNKYNQWWHNIGKVQTAISSELDNVLQKLSAFDEKITKIDTFKSELIPLKDDNQKKQTDLKFLEEKILRIVGTIRLNENAKSDAEKKEALVQEKQNQRQHIEQELHTLDIELTDYNLDSEAWIIKKNRNIEPHIAIVQKEAQIINAEQLLKAIEIDEDTLLKDIAATDKNLESLQTKIDGFTKIIFDFGRNITDLHDNPEHKKLIAEKDKLSNEYLSAKEAVECAERALLLAKDETPLNSLLSTLDNYKHAEQLLEKRPGHCTIDDCPFILSALNSIKAKPETEKAIETWRDNNILQVGQAGKTLAACNENLAKIIEAGKISADLVIKSEKFLKDKIDEVKASQTSVEKEKIKAVEMLSFWKDKKTSLKQRLDELPSKRLALKELIELQPQLEPAKEIIQTANEEITIKKQETQKTNESYRLKKESKQAEIDAIIKIVEENIVIHGTHHYEALIHSEEKALKDAEQSKKNIEYSINENEKKIAVLEDKIKLSGDDETAIKGLKEKESLIRKELKKWDYIRSGLSKSGIQALEIASAAPLLTGIANDLLHSAFGGEFYVDLVTLDPETGAEILEVMITREDGESFPLSEYSGGESVWILQAFKAAQILVNTEKSGIHFMTAFCDEETGALDKEKAERFISMYRALMEKGGFEKLFYISHLPDCQAMADRSLIFKSGGIKVV